MPFWERIAIVAGVMLITLAVARLIDHAIAKRELDPATRTRYRVLRRAITTTVIFVGLLCALLVIPQVRAVAGALLASSAVVAIVIGFAAQTTLGNFIAGILIAFTQPLRIGDRVEVTGSTGVVEEVALMYSFIRLDDGSRLVIPNATLASNTIRNATIVSPEKVAEVTVQVPLSVELRPVVASLERTLDNADVFVRSLDGNATVVVQQRAGSELDAERRERELRLRVHETLRGAGLFA